MEMRRNSMRDVGKMMVLLLMFTVISGGTSSSGLRVTEKGEFKIVQVADMHYADGKETKCHDMLPDQAASCSDLNTTAFLRRIIREENPDLIVFTGDNVFGSDSTNVKRSLDAAFLPAVESGIPWAAVLGNHDEESTLSREELMGYIVTMNHTVSLVNPPKTTDVDGFGNYNLQVFGVAGTRFQNVSVLNLYFLDSGDYASNQWIYKYDWIKPSQLTWFRNTSSKLKNIVEAGDVKAVFVGHDHINDFCGELCGVELCYGGGFGYHAYGKAGWHRRALVVLASLERSQDNLSWSGVQTIRTWKRLDDSNFSIIDEQILWQNLPSSQRKRSSSGKLIGRITARNFMNDWIKTLRVL